MNKFKYIEKSIMSTLLAKHTFIKYTKFDTHKEDSNRWFKFTNPVISLQRTTPLQISNTLCQTT